ncbi:MAG: methyltransferase domain-containing protein, partial [Aggregatilineales bacterium]
MNAFISAWRRLVRFGFYLLYNPFAFTYDAVSKLVSFGAWRCWQRAALAYLPSDGWALELAHGTGDLQLDLASAGISSIGYDLSPNMGRLARRKLIRHGVVPRLARGRAQALPFADGVFRSVVSTFPTDFIIASQTLYEVGRVLADDGVLVIVPSALFTGGGAAVRLLDGLYRITGQRQHVGDQTQAEDMLRAEAAALLEPYG